MRRLGFLTLLAACQPGDTGKPAPPGADSQDSGPVVASDADQDGFAATSAGGDDCDDANPAVNPAASETWYDGLDQDCDGWSDYDQDHDGDDALEFGGGDCADGDPNVSSITPEVEDGSDQDCDDLIDEDFIAVGDVVITEVMPDPEDVADADGEWFEILNVGTVELDMDNWTVRTPAGDFTILGSSPLSPGNPVVIAAVKEIADAGDTGDTGAGDSGASDSGGGDSGVAVDTGGANGLDWTEEPVLGIGDMMLDENSSITILAGETVIATLDWSGEGWPFEPGRSLMVDGDHATLNDVGDLAWWCLGSSVYNVSDRGTPRTANGQCDTYDHDGDGFSGQDGDCDDYTAAVYPTAIETWNAIDDDCDGVVDDLEALTSALGTTDGAPGEQLGRTLALTEVTADAALDLIVGSPTGAGVAYALPGSVLTGMSGVASALDQVSTTGLTPTSAFGAFSDSGGDVTGDGYGDLVVAGASTGDDVTAAIAVYVGGAIFFGDYAQGGGYVNITGVRGASQQQVDTLDLDGDGVHTVLVADPRDGAGALYGLDVGGYTGTLSLDDATWRLEGDVADDGFGLGLGGGDLDGDGYPELLVGAPGADSAAGPDAGAWSVLAPASLTSGAASALAGLRVVSASATGPGLGWGAPGLADLDGSGMMDLVLGTFSGGSVYVFVDPGALLGAGTTLDPDVDASCVWSGGGDFGFAIGVGDFDDDDLADVLVGAPSHGAASVLDDWAAAPGSDLGYVYVLGNTTLFASSGPEDAIVRYAGETVGDLFGARIAPPVNVDVGGDDLFVAAPRYGADEGRVYYVTGVQPAPPPPPP